MDQIKDKIRCPFFLFRIIVKERPKKTIKVAAK